MDLGITGKMIINEKNLQDLSNNNLKVLINKNLTWHLVRFNKTVCKIPSLTIHWSHDNINPFSYNKENHFLPIVSLNLNINIIQKIIFSSDILFNDKEETKNKEIIDYDLYLFDLQQERCSIIGGATNDEFIFSTCLDNLVSCFCAMEVLTKIIESEKNRK